MGQYHEIFNLDKRKRLNPLMHGQGLKMVEHMWCGNSYLYELLHLLAGSWKGDRLFHHGDYAEDVPEEYLTGYVDHEGSVLTYEQYDGFTFLEEQWIEVMDELWNEFDEQYVLVNYDQKLYCTLNCCPLVSHGRRICPLPLLLSNSEVIASGDYTSFADYKSLHTWRYDRIGLEPKNASLLEKMKRVDYAFG